MIFFVLISLGIMFLGIMDKISNTQHKKVVPITSTVKSVQLKEYKNQQGEVYHCEHIVNVEFYDNSGCARVGEIVEYDDVKVGDKMDIYISKKGEVIKYYPPENNPAATVAICVGLFFLLIATCVSLYMYCEPFSSFVQNALNNFEFSETLVLKLIMFVFAAVFGIIGVGMLSRQIKINKKFKGPNVVNVEVTICNVDSRLSNMGVGKTTQGTVLYQPTYEFYFNGERKEVVSNVATNSRSKNAIGRKLTLPYNYEEDLLKIPGDNVTTVIGAAFLITCLIVVGLSFFITSF